MIQKTYEYQTLGVRIESSVFHTGKGADEVHIMVHVDARGDLFEAQLMRLQDGVKRFLTEELTNMSIAMQRYFLSDATNQAIYFQEEPSANTSLIQQPPLDGSKVALWMYLIETKNIENWEGTHVVKLNKYTLLFDLGMQSNHGTSAEQTTTLLEDYEKRLAHWNATIADNCIRTWFYVRDVDIQYAGMVKARKENFTREGLTHETHYIASTGIQGLPSDPKSIIQLGAMALLGACPSQQRYLYGATHLNPTYEYGVTFERGTAIDFGDRTHAYISGTASINNRGEVVHIGDIIGQTNRMMENVEVLLAETDMNAKDVAQIIVYLRDICDYTTVKPMIEKRFKNVPMVITVAPVCRPEWLIEMECIAIKQTIHEEFENF